MNNYEMTTHVISVFILQRFFQPTARKLRRYEAVTRSPIYNHFTESITGGSVIRYSHSFHSGGQLCILTRVLSLFSRYFHQYSREYEKRTTLTSMKNRLFFAYWEHLIYLTHLSKSLAQGTASLYRLKLWKLPFFCFNKNMLPEWITCITEVLWCLCFCVSPIAKC